MQSKQLTFFGVLAGALLVIVGSCGPGGDPLPKLGPPQIEEKMVDGEMKVDTLGPYQLPYFAFTNQDGREVTQKDYDGRVYVADFFFTTCSTICPVMNTNLTKVWDAYRDNEKVMFLSHTIDPDHDDQEALKAYKDALGVTGDHWNFVTGEKAKIFDLAQQGGYMVTAYEDKNAQDGRVHTAALVLVDQNRHIRGHYDGTQEEEIQQLIQDIERVLDEE